MPAAYSASRFFQAFLRAKYCCLRSLLNATRSIFGFSTFLRSSCGERSCGIRLNRATANPLESMISSRSASRSSIPMCEGSSSSTIVTPKNVIVQIRKSTRFCAMRLRAALFSGIGSKNACIETCGSTMYSGGGSAFTSKAYISRSEGVSAFFALYLLSIFCSTAQRPAIQG